MNKFLPRKKYVIVRVINRGQVGRVAVSERAEEAREYHVTAVGPDVLDLKVGDRVVLFADKDATFFAIPGEKDLVVIRDDYISCVVERREG